MKKMLFIVLIPAFMCLFGCAAGKGYLEGPLASCSREAFINEGSRDTVLYIEGESWYTLINLQNFRFYGPPLENENQFLSQKDDHNSFVSIFAEKIDGVGDSTSCRVKIYKRLVNTYGQRIEFRDLGSKRVLTYTLNKRKYIHYCPFYKGYCFDFLIVTDEKTKEDAFREAVDSIAFIDDESIRGKTGRVFAVYDKKVRIIAPETWKYQFKANIQYDPQIILTPAEGNDFLIYLLPYSGFQGTRVSEDNVRAAAEKMMARWEDRAKTKPSLTELQVDNATVYYFDAEDSYYHKDDAAAYSLARQGYAIIDTAAFSFNIFYRESSREAADRGLNAITHAMILGPQIMPLISLPK